MFFLFRRLRVFLRLVIVGLGLRGGVRTGVIPSVRMEWSTESSKRPSRSRMRNRGAVS